MDLIARQTKQRNFAAANKSAAAFFKAYPKSPGAPDVWIMLGDMETTPDRAVEHYRAVLTGYKKYRRCDYARYRICEIHYLLSRWEPLRDDALPGTRLAKSRYYDAFLFFSVISLMRTDDYEREQLCRPTSSPTMTTTTGAHAPDPRFHPQGPTGHSENTSIDPGNRRQPPSADAMPAALVMLGVSTSAAYVRRSILLLRPYFRLQPPKPRKRQKISPP